MVTLTTKIGYGLGMCCCLRAHSSAENRRKRSKDGASRAKDVELHMIFYWHLIFLLSLA